MVKHIQTIRRQIVDELLECLTILWGWRIKGSLSCAVLIYEFNSSLINVFQYSPANIHDYVNHLKSTIETLEKGVK